MPVGGEARKDELQRGERGEQWNSPHLIDIAALFYPIWRCGLGCTTRLKGNHVLKLRIGSRVDQSW